ncbi:MAG: hypothetical protein JNJ43_14415 [Anaerolineales bacterium]|nr:hypothetical protein [Anaerolineales bacterium]
MKKNYFIFLSIFVTFACVLTPTNATPIPIQTDTQTFTPLPTLTPVPPTSTFTLTPTLIGLPTQTATQEETATATFSNVTPLALFTPNTATPIFQMQGFVFVNVNVTEFYKGRTCEPSFVKITAQASNLYDTAYVLLFTRFKSLTAERASKWTKFDMYTIGAGTYVYDVYSDEMLEDGYFQTAWIEYQIVATNSAGKEIGRTDIFKEKVKMLACVPPTSTVKP